MSFRINITDEDGVLLGRVSLSEEEACAIQRDAAPHAAEALGRAIVAELPSLPIPSEQAARR